MGGERDLAIVGRIVKPHGLEGELKVFSYIGKPALFEEWDTVFVEKNEKTGKWIPLERVRFQHKWVLIKLFGLNSRDNAESYRGSLLYKHRDDVESPDDNNFPLIQVSGMIAETVSGVKIGIVKDILLNSAQNIIIIDKGKDEILIPFVKEFIKKVDFKKSKLLISPIEGLLDNAD